ncbi:hypothetical protein KP509_02G049200 [Ceratopteris richardii]|uniref:Uncharacterized protein n=1 Tax=Ceratopteris richardii TaxID=49495 RepID=A0A8T2VCQ6_CERRI|nr:hypothetical protein KP509_02G049200 [Ceratopteris richardii]
MRARARFCHPSAFMETLAYSMRVPFICGLERPRSLATVQRRVSFPHGFRLSSIGPSMARMAQTNGYKPSRANSQEVLNAAWEILDEFNRNDVKGLEQPSLETPDGVFALGASVLAAIEASRTQDGCLPLLGICADNCKEALATLQRWTKALNCDFCMPQVIDSKHDLNSIPGPVYVKYNAHAKVSYLQPYAGKFRGVIVQIGQKQVGHLPLYLFK